MSFDHVRARQRGARSDAAWFDANPLRRFRLRSALAFEKPGWKRGEHATWWALCTRGEVRFIRPTGGADRPPADDLDDNALAALWGFITTGEALGTPARSPGSEPGTWTAPADVIAPLLAKAGAISTVIKGA